MFVGNKRIQADMKKVFLSSLFSWPSYIEKVFFQQRSYKDAKRNSCALLILERKGHLWLNGYALYI